MARSAPRLPRRVVALPPRRSRPSGHASARQRPLGQLYYGEYAPYRVTRRVVVLQSVARPCAFLTSEVSGAFDPGEWIHSPR